ncbi:MAG TPA: sugar ABC transporter permease [Chloroflexota bacterium]|nr:sugar ABC transporter permease [Chloroflexota bacterium]
MAQHSAAVPPARRRRGSRQARRENIEGWLFASPWIIGFLLFTLGPMVAAAAISLSDWNLLTRPRFVGLANFHQLFTSDPLFWQSLKVTTLYAVAAVLLGVAAGLILALLLNAPIRGLRWYRTAYYMPSVLAGVAVALLWSWLFSPDLGLLNYALQQVGVHGPDWLGQPEWALPALIIMSLWAVGSGAIIYLAGLQGIPTELYEAAQMDGAGVVSRFLRITVPLMTPVLFFQVVVGIIGALQTFTQAYVMTSGGPNNATLFFVLYLYQNAFQYFRMGYAAALAWVLFTYILILTIIVFRTSRSWVYYEGQLEGVKR